jgi:hypothetical protein
MRNRDDMVRMEKPLIVKLYCYIRQAERSVHRALANLPSGWPRFQEYYAGAREEAIRSLIHELSSRLSPLVAEVPPPWRLVVDANLPMPGMFRILLGKWLTRWRRSWLFAKDEIQFFAWTLQTLLDVRALPTKPMADVLILLRMDCCSCGGFIDLRCWGLEELQRAKRIEHFDRTEWYPHLQLSEILPSQGLAASLGRETRNSASA